MAIHGRSAGLLRRLFGVCAAAALPLLLLGSGSVVSMAAPDRPDRSAPTAASGWASGLWMSSSTNGTGISLKDVRAMTNGNVAASYTGQGVGIALIDTGIAPVPGLPAAQIVNGPDLSFESQASNLRHIDTYGHGTHMAGIIVGNDAASGTVGLAPKAKLTSIKVGTANGATDVSQVIAAIDWVVANRNHDPAAPIRVLNLSYGSGGNPTYTSDPVQYAVEQAWKAGIVVVAAAGNNGNSANMLTNPASDPFVIAVGSTNHQGTIPVGDDSLSTFTNLPPLTSSRWLDIVAPGEGILSLRDPGSNIDESYPTARVGETLFRGSGTSQSAAIVSASVAIMLQQRPSLTPDQVKRIIWDTGTPLALGAAGQHQLRTLNVLGALAAPPPTPTQTWTPSTGTGQIEAARGYSHVVRDNVTLSGEKTIFGTFSSPTWASLASQKKSWSGGTWLGTRMAGDTWTGAVNGTAPSGQIGGLGGKCLNVASSTNGTAAQLADCAANAGQHWTVMTDGTVRAWGKCLELKGGATASGTPLQLSDCKGTAGQKWAASATGELKNPGANRCADVLNGAVTNGTPVQLKDCSGVAGQKWALPFAAKTWGAAAWPGKPWSGAASWVDPDWAGRYWAGRYWAGRYWSGRYWASDDWSSAFWG